MFIPDPDFFPIPDPESGGPIITGSRNRIRSTVYPFIDTMIAGSSTLPLNENYYYH
jgi:hypothetical protein